MRASVVLLVLALATAATAVELPPRNPHLADSVYPLGHGDSAQQDSVAVAGPRSAPPRLAASHVDEAHTGPAHFGATVSGPYEDGRRVIWSNGLDRIVKLDHESFEVLATAWLTLKDAGWDEAYADRIYAAFDRSTSGPFAILRSLREMWKLRELSGVYTLLDADGVYYIGDKAGTIVAHGDATPGDPESPIVILRRLALPEEVTGALVGMNLTYDGWIVVGTEHGYLVALRRDFSEIRVTRLRHSEGAEEKATGRTGYGWVRNGFAIDAAGGIYVASQDHMHKVVWTGDALSTDPADGAWTARYRNGSGDGTGATPSLMGFGDEDRFVVITDGEPRMNLTLFWRDAIPDGFESPEGAPDARIAGMLPADMGDPGLAAIQSEQSVVVAGYGALVVNNQARGVPWYVPRDVARVMAGFQGSDPAHQPYGVQRFHWDPGEQRLAVSWVNAEISSPSCVPLVSHATGLVYLIGAREGEWTLEALDWESGAPAFHSVIGGQRFNPLFSGTLLDQAGRIFYGTPFGRVRLRIPETAGIGED
ncbi:MAG: hypothetical protein QNK05_05750 [Myxococcota bacterium]|nr:hypothetical protein [Myxococcota bacterium]